MHCRASPNWLVIPDLKLGDQMTETFSPQNRPSTYSSQQHHQHNNSPAVDSEAPFYLSENRYSPITLPSAPIEFGGNEYHFVNHQSNPDNSSFGTSGSESYPVAVDAAGHEHHSHGDPQELGYPIFDGVDPSRTSFM